MQATHVHPQGLTASEVLAQRRQHGENEQSAEYNEQGPLLEMPRVEGDFGVVVGRDVDRVIDVGEAFAEGLVGGERLRFDLSRDEPVPADDLDGSGRDRAAIAARCREPDLLRNAVGENVKDLRPFSGLRREVFHAARSFAERG